MELLNIPIVGKTLSLRLSQEGMQDLYLDNELVSQSDLNQLASPELVHRFELTHDNQTHLVSLNLQFVEQKVQYQLWLEDQRQEGGEFLIPGLNVQAEKPKTSFLGIAALALKLFKSVKVIKVALAGASVAGYAWLFSLEFALVLVACLVAHEYGHVKAMQYFGIKTKGIYLIPFVGGLAVSDDKINTRWQDVVISIMGPCFGLIMSILCLVLYGLTEHELFAGAAVISSLLNLFNLFPILPLDGGHVIKSVTFSMRSWIGLSVCMSGLFLGGYVSYVFGLSLFVFFLFIGAIETIFQWRQRHASVLIPLDRYGQIFSMIWYVLLCMGHVGVIVMFANSDNPILKLPLQILSN